MASLLWRASGGPTISRERTSSVGVQRRERGSDRGERGKEIRGLASPIGLALTPCTIEKRDEELHVGHNYRQIKMEVCIMRPIQVASEQYLFKISGLLIAIVTVSSYNSLYMTWTYELHHVKECVSNSS